MMDIVERISRRLASLDKLESLIHEQIQDDRADLSTLKAELGLSGGQPELLTESAPAGTGTESAERRGGPAGAA